MKFYRNHFQQHKHFLLLGLFPLLLLVFFYCEKTVVAKYYMHSFLDDRIPFIKEFVIPYYIWYAYLAFGFLALGLASKNDFYKFYIFVAGGMLVCYTIYLILPNAENLRPKITGTDFFSTAIKKIYSVDTPTNVSPSIHVFDSIAVHIGIVKCSKFKNKTLLKLVSFIFMILISASTVFIKQHSIIDVFWAIVLAAVFFISIYVIPETIPVKKKWSEA